MKRLMVLLLLSLLWLTMLSAEEVVVQFDQANGYYRSGDYKGAAAAYEKILSNGYEHAALYYNLGNSYFKEQNLPAAILNFERARRLAPHDDDIRYNLRLANLRIIDRIEPLPQLFFVEWWQSILYAISMQEWAIAAIAALWCAAFAGGVFFFFGPTLVKRFAFFAGLMFIAIAIFAFTGSYQRFRQDDVRQSAIVFHASVTIKSAPDMQSTDLFVLHEGVKVELLDAVGEWRKIQLPDGKIGWLGVGQIQII